MESGIVGKRMQAMQAINPSNGTQRKGRGKQRFCHLDQLAWVLGT